MDPSRMAPTATQLRPLDTLWDASTIIRIVLAGEALALVLALAPGVSGDRLTYFGLASFATQWIALMAMGMLFLGRRRLSRASPMRGAQAALVALLVSTWLVCGLAWVFLRDIRLEPAAGWRALTLQLTFMALTVGLLALAAFRAHWHIRQMAVRAKQAELEALQARLRPHFLFNTLNTGIALVHSRPEEAERLLLDLSDLFRAALAGPADVTIDEELTLARRYLEIEALRFRDRLEVSWHVTSPPTALLATRLPSLSVQPLVENAIRHGIEPDSRGGRIAIHVECTDLFLTVTVRNSLPEGARGSGKGHGIGIAAVRARIEARTGGGGTLETSSTPHQFTSTLRIPRSPEESSPPQVTTS
jgi:two-component system sensor histidine kinase AlgZ